MIRVLSIFGTRPEAIKMAPVIRELEKHRRHFENLVCVTAQHREMLDQVLELFKIKPAIDLNLMKKNQTLPGLNAKILTALERVFQETKPHWILVQGDTTTVMAASVCAFYHGIKVGHIEAGLRTNNKRAPFPEEINRRITSVVADYHFAPTQYAADTLAKEGIDSDTIFVTGNTVIDALFMTLQEIKKGKKEGIIAEELSRMVPELPGIIGVTEGKTGRRDARVVLVTGHRRESFGKPFEEICRAIKEIVQNSEDVHVVYPVHLNPNVRKPVNKILKGIPRIHLIDPLPYEPFLWLMEKSEIILTDSGGIQEEGPSLGKPVLVMRETTERPEGVEAGCTRLVGVKKTDIVNGVMQLLTDRNLYRRMARIKNPYGDGKAAARIVSIMRADEMRRETTRSHMR